MACVRLLDVGEVLSSLQRVMKLAVCYSTTICKSITAEVSN